MCDIKGIRDMAHTWHIHMNVWYESHSWHGSFVTWLIRDMAHSWHHPRHGSFVKWIMCDIRAIRRMAHLWKIHRNVWHDSHSWHESHSWHDSHSWHESHSWHSLEPFVTWLIHDVIWDKTFVRWAHVWHESYVIRDMAHSWHHPRHGSFVRWLMCDMRAIRDMARSWHIYMNVWLRLFRDMIRCADCICVYVYVHAYIHTYINT